MPCFLTGVAAAEGISAVAGLPCYRFSHQCGHMMAATLGAAGARILSAPFGAFHVSGGTTELVRARYTGDGFSCEVVGGSRDLHAGQVIDRIGVLLGLAFPAGPALEKWQCPMWERRTDTKCPSTVAIATCPGWKTLQNIYSARREIPPLLPHSYLTISVLRLPG